MNPKTLLAFFLFFSFAALDILLLSRRLEAKIQSGAMTRAAADQQKHYQWRLFIYAVVIAIVGGIAALNKPL